MYCSDLVRNGVSQRLVYLVFAVSSEIHGLLSQIHKENINKLILKLPSLIFYISESKVMIILSISILENP